jgi:hypothetical protein
MQDKIIEGTNGVFSPNKKAEMIPKAPQSIKKTGQWFSSIIKEDDKKRK